MTNDRKVAIFLFFFSIFIFINAYRIPNAELQRGPGPSAFPVFLVLILACLAVALFVTAGQKKHKTDDGNAIENEIDKEPKDRLKRILTVIVCLIFYFVLLPIAGFIITTILFGVLFLHTLFNVKLIKGIVPATIISTATYLVFEIFLRVPLPRFMEAIK